MAERQDIIWLDEAPSENITWLDENPNAEVLGQETQKRSVNDALTQAFSFTPGSAFNLVAGIGGAMQSATMPVKSPIEVWKPKEVERGRSILGLAGAMAHGGWALPALFTAEGAVSPALEKYAKGEDISLKEAIPEGVIGIIDKIGELLGNTEDAPGFARAMITALEQQDSPTVLGMKIETPEQRQAVGQLVAAGAYLAVMPSTLRKMGTEVGARAKALPRIAKARGLYNENLRALIAELKIKNPDMPPDAVKSLAEFLTNKRMAGKADIVMEQTTIKPNAIKTATSTMEAEAKAMIEGVISKDVKGRAIKPTAPKIPDISFTPTEGGKVTHGTDITNLSSILNGGLRSGSAIDTNGKWSSEYPVKVELEGVRKGEYVKHNDYYKSANVGKVKKVTIDIDQYDNPEGIKGEIISLIRENPKVQFEVLQDGKPLTELSQDLRVTKLGDTYVVENENLPIKGERSARVKEFDNRQDAENYAIINSGTVKLSPTEGGKVIKAYHGTNKEFDTFEPTEGVRSNWLGGTVKSKSPVFFFSKDKKAAKSFAKDRVLESGGKARVVEADLTMNNTLDMTGDLKELEKTFNNIGINLRKIYGTEPLMGTLNVNRDQMWELFDKQEIVEALKKAGYDSAIIDEVGEDGADFQTYVIFDAKQIKTSSKLSPTEGKAEKPTLDDRMAKVEEAKQELEAGGEVERYLLDNKVKKYSDGFLKEELSALNRKYVTTNKNANTIDQALDELRSMGYDFANEYELTEYLKNWEIRKQDLKETIEANKARKVTKYETTALKEKLANIQRGIRSGQVIAREEIKAVQTEVIKMLKSSDLEAKDRAKFLDTIKNIQTQEQLEKAIPTIVGRMARLESMEMRRGVKADIAKELKYTKPVKSGQKKVGKYDYESNKFFEEIRGIAKTSQAEAQTMLDAMPKEGLTDIELIKARILSLQANGMDASLDLHNQVLNDIQTLKVIGMASKDDADFNKRMLRRERAEEVLEAVKTIKGNKDTITGKIANAYRLGFSNTYSLLNSIAGKDMAEKYDPEMKENTRDTAMFAKTKEVATEASKIFNLDSPAKITQSLQDMASEKFELTDIEGLTTEITKLQILDIYNSIKNDLVRERYYNAFGEKQVTDMIGNLSTEEKRFGDYIQEVVQEYRDILNQMHIEITGRDLGFVENYWPATSEYEPSIFDDIKMQGETPSALKERAKSGKVFPKPKDAWMKMQKHIAQAEHVKELSREYEMLKKLFSDRHVKNAIETKFGEKVYQSLMDRIDYISLNKRTEQVDSVSGVYGKMMANWVAAKIANPTVFARQLVSVINYAETMPTGEWANGFVKGLLTPKQTFDFMWKNAPFLEARFNKGYSEALKDAIRGADSLTNSLHKNWLNGLTKLTRAGDISAIIYGGYSYVVHEMKTKPIEEVMKNFETITLKSQQSGVTSGLSPFQNTSNPIARVLLAFKNTANQYLRKQVDAMIAYGNGDIGATQLAKTTIIYSIINPLLYLAMGAVVGTAFWEAVGRFFRGESKDTDWGEVWSGAAVHLIASPFNAIPLVEDIAQLAGKKLMKQKIYKVFDTPMMDDLEGAFRAITKKDITLLDWVKFLGTGAEVTTGTPINTGLRIYKSLVGEKPKKKRTRITSPF